MSRQESEWDPSYGFLSPQLGTRNGPLQRRGWNAAAPSQARNAPIYTRNTQQGTRSGLREPLTPRNGPREVLQRNGVPMSRKTSVESNPTWNGPAVEQERKTSLDLVRNGARDTPQAIRERSKRFQEIKESRIPTNIPG